MSLERGARVGPYEIVSAIGAGGMGEVYRARDAKLGRDVALKILPDLFASDPERLGRFEREARTLAALNHPQIAHIYGFEQSPSTGSGRLGVSALVMELVEGEDLSQRIARGAIPLDEALPIAKQIADALEAAHEQGIIHRDLKPANIKLRADGTVKVLDFGLAKALDGHGAMERHGDGPSSPVNSPTITSPAMTERGMILGTAAYMAPEQAKGKLLDKRADIWAFGAVVYEMLTGKRAFPGEDITETLAFVITRDVDWAALPPATPASIRKLLQRCLQKDRKRRLADASDARLEIEDALSPSVVPEITRSTARPGGGWRRVLAAAAISGAVCAAAGALAVRQWWTPTPPLASPVRFVIVAPPNQQFRAVGRTVSLSPDGSQMALALSEGIFLRSIGSLELRLLTGADAGALNPTFSPDAQSIAYWSVRDQTIKSISVKGGAPVIHGSAVRDGGAIYSGMSWDRAGIIVAQGAGGVVRFPTGGGPAETILEVPPGESAASPVMLPDGEHLLYTVVTGTSSMRWTNAQIVAQSMKTRARKQIVARGSDPVYLSTGHLVFAVDGVLFAGPFDLTRLELTAPAVPVVEGVRRASVSTQVSQFSVAGNGTLAYVPGPLSSSSALLDLAVFDRKGTTTAVGMPPGAYEAPRMSPDGKHVAFNSDDGTEAAVWTYELGALMVLSTADMQVKPFGGVHSFTPTNAAFAPDSRWVAYGTTVKGRPVSIVFVQPFPATGGVNQVSRDDDGHHPAWTRGGKELVYVPGPGRLAAVTVTTAPSFSVTRPIMLPAAGIQGPPTVARNFDVVDATRFVGLVAATDGRPAEQTAPQVYVVLNWLEELKTRVPAR